MRIELANKIRGGRTVGNEYVVTRRDEGKSGIIAKFDTREQAQAFIDNGGEIVRVDGVEYAVLRSRTPEQSEADGHHNIAASMRDLSQARHLYLKRPKGNVMYFTAEYTKYGRNCFGSVVSLGAWS